MRPTYEYNLGATGGISIHAPVKGATWPGHQLRLWHGISIHAPVKGATVKIGCLFIGRKHFNPRTREGCDVVVERHVSQGIAISIHAPVKGATIGQQGFCGIFAISIHAPVKGATRQRPSG